MTTPAAAAGTADTDGRSLGTMGGQAFGVFASSALTLGVGFVTTLVIARALGPSDQGILATIRTDAAILTSVLAVGVPAALYYFASQSEEARPGLMAISLGHAAALTGAALALVLVAGDALAEAQASPAAGDLFALIVLLVPATYLEYCYLHMLRGEERYRLANVLTVVARVAGLGAAAVVVVGLDLGVRGALAVALLVSLVQVVGALPVLLRTGLRRPRRTLVRGTASYGMRSYAGVLLRFTALRFDVLLLSFFAPSRVVGYYVIAQILAELVTLASQALGWVLAPVVVRSGRPELTRQLVRLNGTLSLLAAALMAGAGPLLISWGYGAAYEPAIVPFLILLPGIWLLSCAELVIWVLPARGRPGLASWLAAYQAGSTLVLDLILIPPFGLTGAAIASCVSYSTYGVLCLAVLARHDDVRVRGLLLSSRPELKGYAAALRRRAAALRA